MLLRVDRAVPQMKYMDAVCDLLYHIEYQFTGDSVKQDAENPPFQLRHRFIAQIRNEEAVVKQEQSRLT